MVKLLLQQYSTQFDSLYPWLEELKFSIMVLRNQVYSAFIVLQWMVHSLPPFMVNPEVVVSLLQILAFVL
jgi:hypothetical protein